MGIDGNFISLQSRAPTTDQILSFRRRGLCGAKVEVQVKMASYHETWEKSLQSILSDTETNIASLKVRNVIS